ncbi:DUF6153 family protein [Leucobacter sp. Z1108]
MPGMPGMIHSSTTMLMGGKLGRLLRGSCAMLGPCAVRVGVFSRVFVRVVHAPLLLEVAVETPCQIKTGSYRAGYPSGVSFEQVFNYRCYGAGVESTQMTSRRTPVRVRGDSSVRTILTIVGAVLLVIIGLLGMHTFSAGSSGHASATHSSVSHEAADPSHVMGATHAATALASANCDDGCVAAAHQPMSHDDMMMACVLALLAGFVLLLPLARLTHTSVSLRRLSQQVELRIREVLPHPPSLIVLSISRT